MSLTELLSELWPLYIGRQMLPPPYLVPDLPTFDSLWELSFQRLRII
jgi:hypothetical protein